ncbi:MAG: glycosyltransferase, partial [Bacteroidales bacterium]|nr:glycosyltransferase [Bacteroidales bacterium]
MLSILIPVYRFDYHSLLDELVIQCRNLQIDFEILVGDDSGYPDNQNPLIQNEVEGQVKIFKRTKPLGRSANRNDLASRACYRYLLFIDGDAGIVDKGYVKRYLDTARPGAEVICGGTQYASYKPDEKDLVLRWKYGSHREAIPAAKRKRNPYRSFSSFN